MKADIRDYLDTAISDLLDNHEITVSPGMSGTRKVHVYHRYTLQKSIPTSNDDSCTESTRVPSPREMADRHQPRQRTRTRGKFRATQQTTEHAS